MPDVTAARSIEPPPARSGPTPWALFVAAGVVLIMACVLPMPAVPSWSQRVILRNVLGAAVVVVLVVAAQRLPASRRLPWRLLAAGQLGYLIADVTFYSLHEIWRVRDFPSLADAFYLGHYPLVIGGVLLLARRRTPGWRRRGSLIDAGIIAAGVGVLSWAFLMDPAVTSTGTTLMARLVSIAYPIMDILMLAVAARLVVGGGVRQAAYYLLVASLAIRLVTDSAYIYAQMQGFYQMRTLLGRALDSGWMASYLALAAAALHPSMPTVGEAAADQARAVLGRWRLVFLAGAALIGPTVLAVQYARGERVNVAVVAGACALQFLLVIWRMAGLVRTVEVNAAKLRSQGAVLQETLADLEDTERERRKLLDRIMRSSEDMRRGLAAELHDGPIQRLVAMGYRVEEARLALLTRQDDRGIEPLTDVQQRIREEIDELRRMMSNLRPPTLDKHGLPSALRDLLENFERCTGVATVLQGSDGSAARVDPELETILYRVAQEALTNVARHARARHARVQLHVDRSRVELRISDDGVGFDVAGVARMVHHGHFGLTGMRERVEMAGGSYRLLSAPGVGTVVWASFSRDRVPA